MIPIDIRLTCKETMWFLVPGKYTSRLGGNVLNWLNLSGKNKSIEDLAKPLQLPEIKKRAKTLVIDDRPDSLPIQFLVDEGYTVEVWQSVKTLDALEQGRWHVIVLDISGVAKHIDPVDDGFTVLKHIKNNNPIQLIIACSAEQFDPSRHEFFKLADEVLSKPVTPDAMKEKLDRLLRKRFDATATWRELSSFLQGQGLSGSDVKKLEATIVSGIKAGKLPDLKKSLLGKVGDKALSLAIEHAELIFAAIGA